MPEIGAQWLIEEGIGETRAVLIENGEVVAAKLAWPGELKAGEHCEAQLTTRHGGSKRGVATLANGAEALVDHLPPHATEGASGTVRINRAPIAERGRLKRAQARWVTGDMPAEPTATGKFLQDGQYVHSFEAGLWEEVWHSASSGTIAFAGGEILCSVTPAMTVIDVDGDLPPRELALAAIPAIRDAISWFDLGGNIGIDFPTIEAKKERKAVDEALGEALDHWPHERTAMNGFGFVQLVARLEGPSFLHRFATSRTSLCARYALRMAQRTQGAGVTLLTVHPAIKAKLKSEWLEALQKQTGRDLRIETDPGLALEAPHAQVVSQ